MPDPVSPKSLVTELMTEDESYLRPSTSNGSVPHNHVQQQQLQPLLPVRQHQQQQITEQLDHVIVDSVIHGCHGDGECCRSDSSPLPSTQVTGTLHKARRNRNAGADGGGGSARTTPATQRRVQSTNTATVITASPGYHRATSCIEENKYTHIWEMPLPTPGE
jgi:hypothetical protein